MNQYIKVNNRELTLEQYFKNLSILGDCACAKTIDDSFIASLHLPSMGLVMIDSIRSTLAENELMLEDLQIFPVNHEHFRIWLMIRKPKL